MLLFSLCIYYVHLITKTNKNNLNIANDYSVNTTLQQICSYCDSHSLSYKLFKEQWLWPYIQTRHVIVLPCGQKEDSLCRYDQVNLGCKMLIMEWLRLSPGRRLQPKAKAKRKAGNIC